MLSSTPVTRPCWSLLERPKDLLQLLRQRFEASVVDAAAVEIADQLADRLRSAGSVAADGERGSADRLGLDNLDHDLDGGPL